MNAPALDAAVELLVSAVEAGMRDLVVCPGSRSQALALVAAELERAGRLRLHVRIDERSAAFFALGLARESERAVAIVTTSGTAVANLHPALLEAHHAGVPLVALTADRPDEVVGTGANQTTLQPGIFGPLIPSAALPAPDAESDLARWRAAGAAMAGAVGAWHLNVAFREPLSGVVPDLSMGAARTESGADAGGAGGAGAESDADSADVAVADGPQPARAAARPAARPTDAEIAAAIIGDDGAHWPGGAGDRKMPRIRPQGLSDELAAAIAADLAAHPPKRSAHPAQDFLDNVAAHTPTRTEPAVSPFGEFGPRAPGTHPEASRIPLELDPVDWPRAVVIAGDRAGAVAERIARKGGWPLFAEPSSGARFGPNLVLGHRVLLGDASPAPGLRDGIELAIVVGHPTLSREIPALLRRDGLKVIVVDDPAVPPYRPRPSVSTPIVPIAGAAVPLERTVAGEQHVSELTVMAFGASRLMPRVDAAALREEADEWLQGWLAESRRVEAAQSTDAAAPDIEASRSDDLRERARFGRAELAVAREPITRALLADAVWRATWPHDRLLLAASRLIRDVDVQVGGKRIRVHANRGLAGIDGTIAAGLGIATASQSGDDPKAATGTTRVLMGDLAFLHDAGSLLIEQGGETAPRVQLIVGNDGGGTIFDSLEVAQTAAAEAFDRVQFTPQRADVAAIAAAYGWTYRRAATRAELEAALTDGSAPRVVIEVPLDR